MPRSPNTSGRKPLLKQIKLMQDLVNVDILEDLLPMMESGYVQERHATHVYVHHVTNVANCAFLVFVNTI